MRPDRPSVSTLIAASAFGSALGASSFFGASLASAAFFSSTSSLFGLNGDGVSLASVTK